MNPSRRACFAALASVFVLSRAVFWTLGLRFDPQPLQFYWQFIDPALLQHDFWRSIFYLEQQPPAFNAFLGAILHLFPKHSTLAFTVVYLGLGLSLSLALFALMDRLQVDRRIALPIAIVFTLSPSTVLYENLLFYEHPLTILLCLAALFLHRYVTSGHVRDAVVLFSCLALISGIRSVYNLAWFAAVFLFVALASRQPTRKTLRAAAIPSLLLLAFYTKHAILFHNLVPGGKIYTAISLSTLELPPGALDSLIASHQISPLLRTDPFELSRDFDTVAADHHLAQISPPPPRTGIPILDECTKSTDAINWNCAWLEQLLALSEKDSLVVLRHYPSAYLHSVRGNVDRYFWPDTDGWPFDGREDDPNANLLARPLAAYTLVTTGQWPPRLNRPWLSYFVLPALVAFGLIRLLRRRTLDPSNLTLAFILANIIFLTAAVLFLTYGDQNRIRSEISPYFAVLLGLALTPLLSRRSLRTEDHLAQR